MKRTAAFLMILCLLILTGCGRQAAPAPTTQPVTATEPPVRDGWVHETDETGNTVRSVRYEDTFPVEEIQFAGGKETGRSIYHYYNGALRCIQESDAQGVPVLRKMYREGQLWQVRSYDIFEGQVCGYETMTADGVFVNGCSFEPVDMTTAILQETDEVIDTYTYQGHVWRTECYDLAWDLREQSQWSYGDWEYVTRNTFTYFNTGEVKTCDTYINDALVERLENTYTDDGQMVRYDYYYRSNGELEKSTVRNSEGQLVEQKEYSEKGEVRVLTYEYRPNGTYTAQDCYVDGTLTETNTLDSGTIVAKTYYVLEKPVWRVRYTCDDMGRRTSFRTEVLNEKGDIVTRIEAVGDAEPYNGQPGGTETGVTHYTYTEDGQLTKTEEAVPEDLRHRIYYYYDDQGRLLKIFNSVNGPAYEVRYDEKGRITYEAGELFADTSSVVYDYDDQGQCSVHSYQSMGGVTQYQYNARGLMIEEYYCDDNGHSYHEICKYNDYGDLVESVSKRNIDEEETVATYDYQYRDGQWTKCIQYINGKRMQTVTRTYDEEGKLVKETRGEGTTVYTYDDQGRLLTETVVGEEGYITVDGTCKYLTAEPPEGGPVARGEETSCVYLTHFGMFDSVTTYVYNDQGQLIQRLVEGDYGHYNRSYYTYDAMGRLYSEVCYADE